MSEPLPSRAEMRAFTAQSLPSLSRVNLVGMRDSVQKLLEEFGRHGIFAEYTRHDMSHIDTLLNMLDWIVVPQTLDAMSPADWMMTVLAIYLHDAGLVVSRSEFEQRANSDFPEFRNQIIAQVDSNPYSERVMAMPDDERERFLYQEFVRVHHAERIRRWIRREPSDHLGVSSGVKEVVQQLLEPLDPQFRDDLALICESHHLNDLQNLTKYNPRRAYGSDSKETVNLQFIAILLRTVDLLHVTRDRTPSIAFKIVSPSDPKSIEEWYKQMSVVAVRESPARDTNGVVDPAAQSDTVSVTATFHDPLGFFSLTEYLHFAEVELRQSFAWAEQTKHKESLNFIFPWRKIDTSQVLAVNFESKHFAFELDKPKILKLLTGHTLYSNPDVVVRELVQNSLDAVRLQYESITPKGSITIRLDTSTRTLTVTDTGTGMNQQIIEDHFLNVGSSRYRDEGFLREHPFFSAISRFGIGILSTFMVSDEIEVITKSPEEEKARNISIRSLNGKYLIRLLDRNAPEVPTEIMQHGTSIKLKIRAGLALPNISNIARFWILFPGCTVNVQVDNNPNEKIGFDTPKLALEGALGSLGIKTTELSPEDFQTAFKVVEHTIGAVTVAMVLEWQPAYKNWAIATYERIASQGRQLPDMGETAGVCVHGIRVQSTSPGFAVRSILAMSNVVGPRSPATNVARSSLESGPDFDEMLSKIYDIYTSHISQEITEMLGQRGYSVSDAASEGRYLLWPMHHPLTGESIEAPRLYATSLRRIPIFTVDGPDQRTLASLNDLVTYGSFWTIDGAAYQSAEYFLRRMPSDVSLRKLVQLSGSNVSIPDGQIIAGYSENVKLMELFLESFDVDAIEIIEATRQVNMRWTLIGPRHIWRSIIPTTQEARVRALQMLQSIDNGRMKSVVLQVSDVALSGINDEWAYKGSPRAYIFRGSPLCSYLLKELDLIEAGMASVESYILAIIATNWLLQDEGGYRIETRDRVLQQWRTLLSQRGIDAVITEEFRDAFIGIQTRAFDPLIGDRVRGLWGPEQWSL